MKLKAIVEDVITQSDKIPPIIGKINDFLTTLLFFYIAIYIFRYFIFMY